MDGVLAVNIDKIKEISCAIFSIICLTGMIISICNGASSDSLKLIMGDDYIYYDWKQIPLLFIMPVAVLFDLFIICTMVLPRCRKKIVVITQELIIPVSIYSVVSPVFGVLLSIIISFYPLGTDYYKCKPTNIVSSGSYYAKSKEMCKARAYSSKSEDEAHK